MNPTTYLPTIAWRTYFKDVLMVTDATISTPATYKCKISPIDVTERGGDTAKKEVGYCIVDSEGNIYKIITIDLDGDSSQIVVSDDFRTGYAPIVGFQGVVFETADYGKSPYLSPVFTKHLSRTALENMRSKDMTILWRTREKVEFTNTATPSINNYQELYASHYGEFPDVTLITYDTAGVEWERQDKPIRYYVDNKLDHITYDLMEPYSGYIILSR